MMKIRKIVKTMMLNEDNCKHLLNNTWLKLDIFINVYFVNEIMKVLTKRCSDGVPKGDYLTLVLGRGSWWS